MSLNKAGIVNVSSIVRVLNSPYSSPNATGSGTAITGLVGTSFISPLCIVITGPSIGLSVGTLTLSNLSTITSAFSAGGLKEYVNGYYRLDFTTSGAVQGIAICGPENSTVGVIDLITTYDIADSTSIYTGSNLLAVNGSGSAASALSNATVDANNLLKVDVEDWKGAAVPALTTTASMFGVTNVIDNATGTRKADLVSILGTALTETAGYIAGAFKKFFNIQTPVATTASVDQTGDSFARIGVNGAGLSAIPDEAGVTTLLARITSTRAGYFDNLNIGGLVASASAVLNIQNNTFIASDVPSMLERPDSGSETVPITFVFCDDTGAAKDLDSGNPTLTLIDNSGTDLSGRLGAWTHVATGEYRIPYTNTNTDAIAELRWKATGTINGVARKVVYRTQIVDTTAIDFTSADRTALQAVQAKTDHLPDINAGVTGGVAVTGENSAFFDGLGLAVVAIEAKTDLIGTNAADSPNTVTAQTNAAMAATQATKGASNTSATGPIQTMLCLMSGNGFTTTTDSLHQLRLAVDAGGGGGGGGFTGSHVVTVQFSDTNGTLIPNVPFSIPGTGAEATDGTGNRSIGLNTGTYTVVGSPVSGFVFSPETFVVTGNQTATIQGTAEFLPPAPDPSDCIIYYTARGADDQIKDAVVFEVAIKTGPTDTYNGLAARIVSSGTAANNVSFTRRRGLTLMIRRGTISQFQSIVVPDTGSARLEDLLTSPLVGPDVSAP